MKVEIYSDVACPWCYVGEKRFEAALAEFAGADGVEVVFRPFQLDPTASETGVPLTKYLERRFGTPVGDKLAHSTASAAGEGIVMNWDRVISANTRNAHRLSGLALREFGAPVQRALVEALFDAYFTKGLNVADLDVLSDLAASVGIDRERASAYLDSTEGVLEFQTDLAEAANLGVSSVPTFVFDGQYAVEGAQSTSTFAQVLQEVAQRSAVLTEK
ncbi:MAG: DsbA family oxidoreductase [Gemmatimonadetes bacterium]|nr:DsbA family oxidoreductase [Gemmatimonadota bacterium]